MPPPPPTSHQKRSKHQLVAHLNGIAIYPRADIYQMDLQTAGTMRTALARGDFPIVARNMEIIPEEFDSIVKFVTFNYQAASTEKRGMDLPWVAVIDAGRPANVQKPVTKVLLDIVVRVFVDR